MIIMEKTLVSMELVKFFLENIIFIIKHALFKLSIWK